MDRTKCKQCKLSALCLSFGRQEALTQLARSMPKTPMGVTGYENDRGTHTVERLRMLLHMLSSHVKCDLWKTKIETANIVGMEGEVFAYGVIFGDEP